MIIQDYMRNSLKSEINQLITRAGTVATTNDEKGNPSEPVLTLELAKQIAYGLYNSLTLSLQDYDFCVHAIFCHQCPKVVFDYPKTSKKESCELGDLLFIYDEKGQEQGNAMLLQAKKSRGLKFKAYGKERIQLDLYKNWYAFNYQNTAFSTETRKIELPDLTAAQYLLMFPPFDNNIQYRCVLPNNIENTSLAYTNFFSENLVELFTYEKGEKYDITLSDKSTDWSKMIHDLLKINEVLECSNIVYKHRDFCGISQDFRGYINKGFVSSAIESENYTFINVSDFEMLVSIPKNSIQKEDCNSIENQKTTNKPFLVVHISSSKKDKEYSNAQM